MKSSVNSFLIFFCDWASGGTNCCDVAEKTNCDVSEECSHCQFCRDGKWKSPIFSPIIFKFGNGG
jgi:hypothetical protein